MWPLAKEIHEVLSKLWSWAQHLLGMVPSSFITAHPRPLLLLDHAEIAGRRSFLSGLEHMVCDAPVKYPSVWQTQQSKPCVLEGQSCCSSRSGVTLRPQPHALSWVFLGTCTNWERLQSPRRPRAQDQLSLKVTEDALSTHSCRKPGSPVCAANARQLWKLQSLPG